MRFFIIFLALIVAICPSFADNFSVHKLSNGQTVIIKEIHDNKIVTIDTWVKTGSINETDKNNGVAHFLEHLFFKGTEKFPNGEFDKIIESKGAITNAATSKDFTHYYITLPSKDFETALNMHADMLLNPLIPRKELEKERNVVLEEIARSNDNPTTKLYENMNNSFYKTHPYKRKVIGEPEIISKITREEILDFYNFHYVPENMVTIIVGDIDTQKTLKKVEAAFKRSDTPKYKKTFYRKEKPLEKTVEIIDKGNVQTSYLLMGFRSVSAKEREEMAALDVLATILGDGKTSRLYYNIKNQKRLAYSISAGNSTSKDDGLFYIKANYKTEDYEKLKNNILAEIKKIKEVKVSEDELNKAKSIIERDTFYSRESISNISNELGYMAVVFEDVDFYDEYIELIKKVSAAEVQNVAKKYLDTEKMVISVLNPEMTPINDKKTTNNQVTVEPKLIKEQNSVKEFLLSNGSTLILNKNETNEIVAIQIFAKGGEYIEEKPATALLMAAGMLKGTSKYSEQELMTLLEENGIKFNISAGADLFSISIKSTKNEMPLVFQLLDEIVNNSIFDLQELDKIKYEKLALIKKNRDNPMNIAFEEFKTNAWGTYPYSNSGKIYEKFIPTVTQEDIKNLYNKMFCPKNLIISVNGNVDENLLSENFNKIFHKDDQCQKISLKDFKQEFKFLENEKIISKKYNSEASWLILGFPTDSADNLKDFATLKVIDGLLGTGMGSRMFKNIRDQEGLAYQVGSLFSQNANQGVFVLFIGTNPKNVDVAKKMMCEELEKLKKEFVTDEELVQTKDKLLGNYLLSMETNMEKAYNLGQYKAIREKWEFANEYIDLIKNVTASDIIGVANKYFSKPHLEVLVGP